MDLDFLQHKLDYNLIETSILLGAVKLLDSSSKDTPAFNDLRYFPFYYHLGTQIKPKIIYQIGAKLGLIGACFMQGCKTVEEWHSMENFTELTLPASIIESNLKKFSSGKVEFHGFNDNSLTQGIVDCIDLGLLTEKYSKEKTKLYLEFFWKYLNPEGLLVVDYIDDDDVNESFHDFCRVKNREPHVFKTRYGIGIITR